MFVEQSLASPGSAKYVLANWKTSRWPPPGRNCHHKVSFFLAGSPCWMSVTFGWQPTLASNHFLLTATFLATLATILVWKPGGAYGNLWYFFGWQSFCASTVWLSANIGWQSLLVCSSFLAGSPFWLTVTFGWQSFFADSHFLMAALSNSKLN